MEGWLRQLGGGPVVQEVGACLGHTVMGGVSFLAVLGAAQAGMAVAGLHASVVPVASLCGAGAVCAASVAAGLAGAVSGEDVKRALDRLRQGQVLPRGGGPAALPGWGKERKEQRRVVGYAVEGVFLYRVLCGAPFSSVAPSSLVRVGAFGSRAASLPGSLDYATSRERGAVEAFGRLLGCHSCGRRSPPFHADHMPPLKVAKAANRAWWRRLLNWTVTQRFYPQCQPCSQKQAAVVRGLRVDSSVPAKNASAAMKERKAPATGPMRFRGAMVLHLFGSGGLLRGRSSVGAVIALYHFLAERLAMPDIDR